MMDFTSALYLGMTHPSSSLGEWRQLTTGKPGALDTSGRNRRLAAGLAELTGCQAAELGPSTLHLFWDLFHMLADAPMALYIDRAAYPIAPWCAASTGLKGKAIRFFPHHDPEALRKRLALKSVPGRRPVVVTDGFCPFCGKAAPLEDYLDMVRQRDGWLVVDDTQSLGIWGDRPDPNHPYGRGGGGSLCLQAISDPHVILVSSLAKGFGAPLAMLAGSHKLVRRFRVRSQTRVHCSPPSTADISAAEHALAVNAAHGDALRRRLAQRVRFFRARLGRRETPPMGGLFPVQSLWVGAFEEPERLYLRLRTHGVRAVLHHHCRDLRPRVSFVISAGHSTGDILEACAILTAVAAKFGRFEKRRRLHHAL